MLYTILQWPTLQHASQLGYEGQMNSKAPLTKHMKLTVLNKASTEVTDLIAVNHTLPCATTGKGGTDACGQRALAYEAGMRPRRPSDKRRTWYQPSISACMSTCSPWETDSSSSDSATKAAHSHSASHPSTPNNCDIIVGNQNRDRTKSYGAEYAA